MTIKTIKAFLGAVLFSALAVAPASAQTAGGLIGGILGGSIGGSTQGGASAYTRMLPLFGSTPTTPYQRPAADVQKQIAAMGGLRVPGMNNSGLGGILSQGTGTGGLPGVLGQVFGGNGPKLSSPASFVLGKLGVDKAIQGPVKQAIGLKGQPMGDGFIGSVLNSATRGGGGLAGLGNIFTPGIGSEISGGVLGGEAFDIAGSLSDTFDDLGGLIDTSVSESVGNFFGMSNFSLDSLLTSNGMPDILGSATSLFTGGGDMLSTLMGGSSSLLTSSGLLSLGGGAINSVIGSFTQQMGPVGGLVGQAFSMAGFDGGSILNAVTGGGDLIGSLTSLVPSFGDVFSSIGGFGDLLGGLGGLFG